MVSGILPNWLANARLSHSLISPLNKIMNSNAFSHSLVEALTNDPYNSSRSSSLFTQFLLYKLVTFLQVLVRHDAHRSLFDLVYNGRFLMLLLCYKYFVMLRSPSKSNVSIDRLKPVFCSPVHHHTMVLLVMIAFLLIFDFFYLISTSSTSLSNMQNVFI